MAMQTVGSAVRIPLEFSFFLRNLLPVLKGSVPVPGRLATAIFQTITAGVQMMDESSGFQ